MAQREYSNTELRVEDKIPNHLAWTSCKGPRNIPQMKYIALIGDYDLSVLAHRAIPLALQLAQDTTGITINSQWVPTDSITDTALLHNFDGLWCVPASPYRSETGALRAIQFARENRRPFLGTCGGFQHLVIEYARNVLHWTDAEHAETQPVATRHVIAPLSCSMVEVSDVVQLKRDSHIAEIYQSDHAHEGYHCNYGLNPAFAPALLSGPLRATAWDQSGDVRAVELETHPFFIGTLFQPERAALRGELPPLVAAFVRACVSVSS